jgi:hypothetical protein
VGEEVKRELQFDLFCTIANAQNRAMDDGGLFSLDRTQATAGATTLFGAGTGGRPSPTKIVVLSNQLVA